MEHSDEQKYRESLISDIEKLLKELTEDVNEGL